MIEIAKLTVKFGGVTALNNLNITLNQKITGIIGPNGAGKTTLLNAMSGFVELASGEIRLDGKLISNIKPHLRSHNGLARSFQVTQTVDILSVKDNINIGLDYKSISKSERQKKVANVLEYTGLTDYKNVFCSELDGSKNRLVELARCLIMSPKAILLDEPAGGFSQEESATLQSMIMNIPDEFGAQVLLIDHDIDLIKALCSESIVLDFGQLIAQGNTEAVLQDPKVKAAYLGISE